MKAVEEYDMVGSHSHRRTHAHERERRKPEDCWLLRERVA